MQSLAKLSDAVLLQRLHAIVGSHRRVMAKLIAHLGEFDARRLHVERGFSSLFAYCVEELQFSEDEACRRIEAARLARRFPVVFELLEGGEMSLTVLGLLKPYLTDENHRELFDGASGSSVREAKEWLVSQFPQPDVASTIRKLPASASASTVTAAPAANIGAPVGELAELDGPVKPEPPAPTRVVVVDAPLPTPTLGEKVQNAKSVEAAAALPPPPTRVRLEPLSQDRFLVKFTASRELKDKIELARDLMLHTNPGGDLAIVLERAVHLLVADLEKKKLGRTARPQLRPKPADASRVTAATRREVVARDGYRCSFVASDGRRCDARAFLEFDHVVPKGCGGDPKAHNLRLRCRAHNRLEAERAYGKAHVSRAIAASQSGAGKHVVRDGKRADYRTRPSYCGIVHPLTTGHDAAQKAMQ